VNSAYINDLGTAVGWWYDSASNVAHGWVRSPGGHFMPVNDPAAVLGTNPTGISDSGLIVGVYYVDESHWHGFIDAYGTFRTLDYPGAADTSLIGVNNSGAILGTWADGSGTAHGFVYQNGKYTTFDAPGAVTGQGTYPQGISSDGTIVGFTPSADGSSASSWLLRNGHFSSLSAPGAAQGQTWAVGISSSARYVSGAYSGPSDPNGVARGFVATLTVRRGSP
jgi:hypothetical protein